MDRCRRHGQETRVTCSECGDPICPRCMVDTAVGIKCPACAAPPPGAVRRLRRGLWRAMAAGSAAGLITGLILGAIRLGFFQGFLTGLAVSEAVLRAGRRQTGGPFLWAGAAGALVGQVTFFWALAGRPFFHVRMLADLGFLIALAVVYFRLR